MSVVRFGVSLDSVLLDKFDEEWRRMGFANRSEALRNLIRDFLATRELGEGGEVIGAISLLYAYETSGVDYRLNEIEHAHWRKIISSMHIHLDEHNCAEVITLRGKGEEIKKIADSLISSKGVKQGKLVLTPMRIE